MNHLSFRFIRLHHNCGRLVLRIALVTVFFGIYIANQSLVYEASLAVWLSPVCAGIGLIVAADMALSIYKAGLDAQKQQQELKEKKDAPEPAASKKDDGPLPTTTVSTTAVNPSLNQPKQHPNLLRRIFHLPQGRMARVSHDSSINQLGSGDSISPTGLAAEPNRSQNAIRQASAGDSPRRPPSLDRGGTNLQSEDSRFTGVDVTLEASKLVRGVSGPDCPLRYSASGAIGESTGPSSSMARDPDFPRMSSPSPLRGPPNQAPNQAPSGLGKASMLPPIRR